MKTTPQVMGAINLAPDSFYAPNRVSSPTEALTLAQQMVRDGADIIDIGAEPTNPTLSPCLPVQQELDRLLPTLELLKREISIPISVDTSKPEAMSLAAELGISFINDIRALRTPGSIEIVARLGLSVCLMHMSYPFGRSEGDTDPLTKSTIEPIKVFLAERIKACVEGGIARSKIVIDPGIGAGSFGKNLQQNLEIIARLKEFEELGAPILVGVSHKTFIGELLDLPVSERLSGSLAAAAIAVMNGAAIIRAHNVKETVQAVKIVHAIMTSNK